MNSPSESEKGVPHQLLLEPQDNQRLAELCGPRDQNLQQIETRLGVRLRRRGFAVQAVSATQNGAGDAATDANLALALQVVERLYQQTGKQTGQQPGDGQPVTANDVHLQIQAVTSEAAERDDPHAASQRPRSDGLSIKTRRLTVKPRSPGQQRLVQSILADDVNFAIGPAGTGKTFLAVACAVQALISQQVQRVVLVRPAVEAGEKLGFLPGDLAQKVDPYLRPIYDALYEMVGFERVGKLIEQGVIEVAPLAYMRGRTLNECFAILDEAQNTTPEQMKMFLTRIGFGSTAVITGDVTQIDLPAGKPSGLKHVMKVLDGVDGVTFTRFTARDVVRHPLVARIVDAYDHFEEQGGR